MLKVLFSLIIGVGFATLYSQSNYDDLVNISYNYLTPSNFEDSEVKLRQQQFNLSLGYGFDLNDNGDQLNVGLNYQWLGLKTDSINDQPLSIHNTGFGVEWVKNWKNPYWGSTLSAGVAAVSDYKTDAVTGYQTLFMAMLHYGKSEDLIWTFGGLYSDQPFGPWVFPILGVDWKISPKLYFSTILFSHTYLEYAVKESKWYTGLDIRAMGLSFVVSDYKGYQDSYITSFSDQFPYYPFTVSIFNDFYIKKYISLFVKTGIMVARQNKHFTSENEPLESSLYDRGVEPSFYLNTGIALRFRNF